MALHRRSWLLFVGLALGAAGIDLFTKHLLFATVGMPGTHPGIVVIPGVLSLETNLNEGALFGIGQGLGAMFAAISVVAIGGIVTMVSRAATQSDPRLLGALGLITGGILGNLYDRLGLSGLTWQEPVARAGTPVIAVRDWIHFRLDGVIDWPVFNLADTWLVVGAIGLIWISLWPDRDARGGTGAETPRSTDADRAVGKPAPPAASTVTTPGMP